MRKVREILRLRWEKQLPVRQIAQSLTISHSTVLGALRRAEAAGLSWPLPEDLDDTVLEARLYGAPADRRSSQLPQPDWSSVHRELRRKGVTLQLLWLEYKKAHPDGYQYSRFCELYRAWEQKIDVVMRQQHRAGEKMFADVAGVRVPIVDPRSGEVWEAPVFVAALGASSYTYAEAMSGLDLFPWSMAHVRALAFFTGAPEAFVVDNTKTAVARACWYEPQLNRTYEELAAHYGCIVLPTRPRHPRDNAKAESAVQQVERWVLAPLRKHSFFSLSEANQAMGELLRALNERPFQKLEGSRRGLYESLERPVLRPLPAEPYVFARWKTVRANIDYHVDIERSYYSVPYTLAREQMHARYTHNTVEVFHKSRRVASHARSHRAGSYTTLREHMPEAHRRFAEWSPQRLIVWANKTGPATARLVKAILESKPHPEHGYRSALGIIRLGKRYGPQRVEAAAQRALVLRAYSYRSVESILKSGLDRQPLEDTGITQPLPLHENVRGADYYARNGGSQGC